MEQIAENVYLETKYDGVSVAALRTHEGLICIDVPSYPRQARDWVTQLHSLYSRPVRYVIITDLHGDRLLNVRWLNAPIITHRETAALLQQYDKRFPQPLIESLVTRNPDRSRDFRNSPVPQPTLHFTHDMHMKKGNLDLHLLAKPGPTPGSIWVHLPRSGMLFVGDTVPIHTPPLLQQANSNLWLQQLDELRSWLADTILVSGRGGLITAEHIDNSVEFIRALQEQAADHIAAGRPREQVGLAARTFLSRFSYKNLPAEWVRIQIKQSLEHLYDELQLPKGEQL